MENKNFYLLLGNDVEDSNDTSFPKEIVKQTTSSKKADVPPASADPARANKNRRKPTGNEAAARAKNTNRGKEAPADTSSKHQKKPFDRHSRRNADSKKKVRQGWGESTKAQIDAEVEGAEDADEEASKDQGPAPPAAPKGKSLAEYFEELKTKQSGLEGSKNLRQANDGADVAGDKIEKQEEEFVSATANKQAKQKKNKEKKFLDFEAVFADQPRQSAPRDRGERPSNRGERPSNRGGRDGAKKGPAKKSGDAPKKAEINDANFPSL
ncbi:ribosome-associated protein Stm1p [Diutina catenulata]